jgi:nucleoside-diphosphate-sugar epimerase
VAKVLITGASGLIGQILWHGLGDAYELHGVDRRRAPGIKRADLTKPRAAAAAFDGIDAVVDLAGRPEPDTPWSDIWKNNIPATVNALEAARRAGVTRFVYASSNHVTGMYEHEQPYKRIVAGELAGLDPAETPLIRPTDPIRPDSPYALGKALGEAAGRYYADEHGLSVICLRIGTVNPQDRATQPRHFATLLTHADLLALVDCALRAPREHRFGIYYGVSANTWRFWDVDNAAEIGWAPSDNAEHFRETAVTESPAAPRP